MASTAKRSLSPAGPARRKKVHAALPQMPEVAAVPYAKCRPELHGLTEGQITNLIIASDAWQEVMLPILEALDAETQGTRGPRRLYTAHELEAVLLYQRVCGLRDYRSARDRLAGDRREARQILGFADPRNRSGKVIHLRDGIPSEASVSRHKTRFGEEIRLAAYGLLFERLVDEHLDDPAMREEARILDIDGSHVLTHYTCPKTNRGKVTNEKQVTCPDGGFLPPTDKDPAKSGHGFNLVSITTATGLPLAFDVSKINASEKTTATDLLNGQFARLVAPKLDPDKVAVLSGDGGFHAQSLRKTAHDLGLVENIHLASHALRESSREHVGRRNRDRIQIEGYPNWTANGHREIGCTCGKGTIARSFKRDGQGRAIVRTEGRCKACGSITITAGLWRKAQNPTRFTRVMPGEEDKTDWTFGNPMTFNDPFASIYGTGRFGHQEGFHGALVNRFRFLKTKHWHRRGDQARLDATMTFCVMHAVAMEQRRRVRAGHSAGVGSPGSAAATATGPPGALAA